MKKILVYSTIVGVVVGIYCLVCKTKNTDNVSSKPMKGKPDFEPENKRETPIDERDVVKEMYDTKGKNAQAINERHNKTAEIMADAFKNIMEEVEPVEFDEETVEPVIDTTDMEIINELDSLSDELDELLK